MNRRIAQRKVTIAAREKITVSLPGYQTFNTEIDLAPDQKFEIKTDLLKEGSPEQPQPQ